MHVKGIKAISLHIGPGFGCLASFLKKDLKRIIWDKKLDPLGKIEKKCQKY